MRHEIEATLEGPVGLGRCPHHWIIESPNGPTSRGVCKLCSAEREFANAPPESWRGREDEITPASGLPSTGAEGGEDDP